MNSSRLHPFLMNKLPFWQGNLRGSLMIVAESDTDLYLVHEDDIYNPWADTQLYDKARGELSNEIRPLAIWLKFMYYVVELDPPVPFTPEEAQRRSAVDFNSPD